MSNQKQMATLVATDGVRLSAADASDARVISCAAQLFLEQGIAPVKTTDIATASGVGVPPRWASPSRRPPSCGTV